MATNLNSFESGQPAGTAITAGNSGGGAGRAVDSTVGAVTYDTAHAHSGTLSMKVDMAAGTTSQWRWLDGADQAAADGYVRFYLWLGALPSQNISVVYLTDHSNVFLMRVRVRTTGVVDLIDQTGAIMGTTTNAVATGQWVRIEARVTCSATVGQGQVRLYNTADSGTATEDVTTTAVWNTGSTRPGGWRFGGLTSSAASDVFWIDDIASSDAGWIGAATTSAVTVASQTPATAADQDAEIVVSPMPGRMLVAVIASRVIDGSAPTLAVGDVSRNGWTLISDPTKFASSANVGAQLQVEVWACPAVRYDGWPWLLVYAAAMQITAPDVGSVVVSVAEVSGMTGDLAVDSVTLATASAASSITLTAPAPAGGADCFMLAAAVADSTTATTATGTGWSALNPVTSTAPAVGVAAAWREATTGGSVTLALTSGTANWAGVVVALRVAGLVPSQPNPAYPATRLQIGLGYDLATPLSRVRWTDQTSRYLALDGGQRGIQAELGTAQQAQPTLTIRNSDGAYTPRPATLAATATAAGTTSTILLPTATITTAGSVINQNTTFDVDVSGWSGQGATLTRSTAVVNSGQGAVASMLITPDGVTGSGGAIDAQSGAGTVAPGVTYTASMWANSPGGWSDIRTAVDWLDASGTMLSTSFGTQRTLTAGVWTKISDTFTAPAGAVQARMRARHGGTPPAGAVWYVWQAQLTLASDITTGNIHVTDFFRLKTSGGALKQLDVFQVTGLSSSGGTTTITFARADGTPGGALAATAAGDVYAGIPIDMYIPWRLLVTVAGTTYCIGSGWLRDANVSFTDASRSVVDASGADALETLSAANPSALQGEIYRRPGLYAYWPLSDASGGNYAANASGTSAAPLTQTTSKYGSGSATATFGAATQNVEAASNSFSSLLGDPGTGWQQDGLTSADINAQKGFALVGADTKFPSITGGVTIMGAFLMTNAQVNVAGNSTTNPTVMILRNADPGAGVSAGSIIKVSYDRTTFRPIITVWDKDTHGSIGYGTSGVAIAGDWRIWALTFNRTTWALYVGPDLVGSGACNLVANFTGIEIGGEASAFYNGKATPGTHAHIAVYNRMLTAGEIFNLSYAATQALTTVPTPAGTSVEFVSSRAQRKLNTAGWRGSRIINPDVATVSSEDTPSGSVLDLGSELAGYRDALWFSDAAQQLHMRGPLRAVHQTPRAVLGDGLGEIPYQPGQTYSYNPTFVYNDVEITNTTNFFDQLGETILVAIDDTSAAKRGVRTLQRATRLRDNSSAWHLGWWLLARYANPQLRVPSVVVSAAASNDTGSSGGRWAFVAGVEVGDLVTVNRRPLGQPPISIRCIVLSVNPVFDPRGDDIVAEVTLTLGAAPPLVTVAGSSTLGTLAGTVLGV